MKVLSLNLSKA